MYPIFVDDTVREDAIETVHTISKVADTFFIVGSTKLINYVSEVVETLEVKP